MYSRLELNSHIELGEVKIMKLLHKKQHRKILQ
uniref:Uncharacterized protein n=1 Tax=virus sp. ctML55 TaxID=2827627 RepID=A0A8S5RHP1_9VIRU|nr:MAG TPA: hypothetical protein [virus sp. ctML55]DAX00433.1 MAG TPA: hypothetical protein [Bacteriophage sp.]